MCSAVVKLTKTCASLILIAGEHSLLTYTCIYLLWNVLASSSLCCVYIIFTLIPTSLCCIYAWTMQLLYTPLFLSCRSYDAAGLREPLPQLPPSSWPCNGSSGVSLWFLWVSGSSPFSYACYVLYSGYQADDLLAMIVQCWWLHC